MVSLLNHQLVRAKIEKYTFQFDLSGQFSKVALALNAVLKLAFALRCFFVDVNEIIGRFLMRIVLWNC